MGDHSEVAGQAAPAVGDHSEVDVQAAHAAALPVHHEPLSSGAENPAAAALSKEEVTPHQVIAVVEEGASTAAAVGEDGGPLWHAMEADAVLEALHSNETTGLSKPDAAERLARDGPNTMTSAPPRTLLHMAWEHFNNIVTYILCASAIIAGVFEDWADLVLIVIVIVVNVLLGVIQEGRAERATQAISAMVSTSTIVTRNGRRQQVTANLLVAGDIVHLGAGDRIPADVRWISTANLQVTEAALTGESAAVTKSSEPAAAAAAITDQPSMGFASTLVFTGQGNAIVVATGDRCVGI